MSEICDDIAIFQNFGQFGAVWWPEYGDRVYSGQKLCFQL